MSESNQHLVLVQKMYHWICNNLLNSDSGCIMVDLPSVSSKAKPPKTLDDFRPDLYAYEIDTNVLIIGEAKTYNDLEN